MAQISDTAQTLAVVAAFADGPTRVTGIGFIRGKETDRIAAVVTELRRLGIEADEEPDGFTVRPGPVRAGDRADLRRPPHGDVLRAGRACGCRASRSPTPAASPRRSRATGTCSTSCGAPRHGRHYGPARMRIIAIDGPAGSGKSTVARALADRLGPRVPRHRGDVPRRHVRRPAAGRRPVRGRAGGPDRRATSSSTCAADGVTVDGVDATIEIRGPEVSRAVSIVAANPAVRAEMVRRQREWVDGTGRRRARGP